MSYYHTCRLCGANLDPGEKCDCTEKAPPPGVDTERLYRVCDKDIIPHLKTNATGSNPEQINYYEGGINYADCSNI